MKDIYESEMKFGSFSEMDLFEIEKSQPAEETGKRNQKCRIYSAE